MKYSLKKIILTTIILFIIFITIYYIGYSLKIIKFKNNALDSFKESSEKKEIYLTFDDGPTTILTPKVLDILKENKVKATFFVVGKLIDERKDILKRMYQEGHGIGLHTFSHNFAKVYSCNKNFIDEMKQTSDEVYKYLKIRPSAIRFPGGSCKRLNKEFLSQLHKSKFKVYDWNIGIDDGINTHIPPDTLYRKAMTNKFHFHTIFLLMHCNENNINTCCALPRIIKYYKEKGYKFKIITNKTPEYYYRFKN
jgi:peptidoglycan/xylan/chitin deacetylase (PgdA/CDA1 family)